MKTKHRNFIIIFAVVAVIAIAVARFLSAGSANTATTGAGRDRIIAVEAQDVSFRRMTDEREFTGAVNAAYTYVISAKVNGRLMSINKRIGDRVRSNEIVGRIDDVEHRNALEEAQAQVRVSTASLEEASAQLAHTETELRRTQGLFEKGIVSKAELDALNAQHEMQKSRRENARATLRQREVALSQAGTNLENTVLRAAQEGFVAQRHVDGGTLLSTGAPIITVVGIDTVFVELAVTERDYRSISKGKKAVVTATAVPNRTFEGVVYRVAPFFAAASRTAAVEVALKNDGHLLKPGMSARLRIVLDEEENAQTVPVAALTDNNGRSAVFVVNEESVATLVNVTTGINDGQFVQIVSPKIEFPVVTLGGHLLRNGSRVSVANR